MDTSPQSTHPRSTEPGASPTRTSDITVIGASKGTGALIAAHAQRAGRSVRTVSRSPGSGTLHLAADGSDVHAVQRAIRGSGAVIVAVGAHRRDRTPIRTRVTRATIEAMRAEGITRLIVQSSFGVAESADLLPFVTKRLIVPLFLRNVFADHEGQEALVRASGLDWTIVRPGYLTDAPPTGRPVDIPRGAEAGMSPKVSRADVARRIVEILEDPSTYRQALTLGTPRSTP